MFEVGDNVWAVVSGKPTPLVIEKLLANNTCECLIVPLGEKLVIPLDEIEYGDIPDEPSYISSIRKGKRNTSSEDSFNSFEGDEPYER